MGIESGEEGVEGGGWPMLLEPLRPVERVEGLSDGKLLMMTMGQRAYGRLASGEPDGLLMLSKEIHEVWCGIW